MSWVHSVVVHGKKPQFLQEAQKQSSLSWLGSVLLVLFLLSTLHSTLQVLEIVFLVPTKKRERGHLSEHPLLAFRINRFSSWACFLPFIESRTWQVCSNLKHSPEEWEWLWLIFYLSLGWRRLGAMTTLWTMDKITTSVDGGAEGFTPILSQLQWAEPTASV